MNNSLPYLKLIFDSKNKLKQYLFQVKKSSFENQLDEECSFHHEYNEHLVLVSNTNNINDRLYIINSLYPNYIHLTVKDLHTFIHSDFLDSIEQDSHITYIRNNIKSYLKEQLYVDYHESTIFFNHYTKKDEIFNYSLFKVKQISICKDKTHSYGGYSNKYGLILIRQDIRQDIINSIINMQVKQQAYKC